MTYTGEKLAAYMRAYRKRKGRAKRPDKLDRSRPPAELRLTDPYAYNRRYMRWWRAEQKRKATENDTGVADIPTARTGNQDRPRPGLCELVGAGGAR